MIHCFWFYIFSMALKVISSQDPNLITASTMPATSNYEELLSSIPNLKDVSLTKKDKFFCLLNLFKTILLEELENAQVQITKEEDKTAAPIDILEGQFQIKSYDSDDELIEKQEWNIVNDTSVLEKTIYDQIIAKLAAALSKSKIVTTIQSNEGLPNMASVFKQKQINPYSDLNKVLVDDINAGKIVRQIKSPVKAVLTAETNVQANLSPNLNVPVFTIPCQRASDILEGPPNIAMPKQAFCENVANIPIPKTTVNSIAQTPKPTLPSPSATPVTLSVNCADLDDPVAMIFKPKAISLMQLYGNLLKKITVTVLVPHSISKIGT